MKSTAEIISILKKFKQESAHKYGIKSLGILAHLPGTNKTRQVIWISLSLFKSLTSSL